ncbi:MAG: hypothetical protein WC453_02190 [Patescibacteria group bacterium]
MALMLAAFGCQEKIPVEPTDTPIADGQIAIKVSNLYKTASGADTVETEKFLKTTYQAIAKNGVKINAWQWTFAENNYKSANDLVEFWHSLDPGAVTSVTLVGIDESGQAHTTTVYIKIVFSLDGLPGFTCISTASAANGFYNLVFIAHKKALQGVSGAYGYSGNVTTPSWTVKVIPPADTNFNYVNGSLVPADPGSIGKFVAIRLSLTPGNNYQLPVGRVSPSGTLNWGSFWGPFPENKFSLSDSGVVSTMPAAILPGTGGDTGPDAVIRHEIDSVGVTIYTRHLSPFNHGFIQLQDSAGVWLAPLAESPVDNFPNWGKIKIKFADFPMLQILIFRFGPDINNIAALAENMPASGYWDGIFNYLKLKIVPVLGKKH